jgi:hypothetical protein
MTAVTYSWGRGAPAVKERGLARGCGGDRRWGGFATGAEDRHGVCIGG